MKGTLFIFIVLALFGGANSASAEISTPYVVDEKSPVLFGDSAEIVATSTSGQVTTYNGLENYTYDYINNYLHITFTYTHSRFSFASYPPRLYITSSDPQATSTAVVRDQSEIYTLQSIPVPPGHETDWYLYDLQFDDTGYNATITQGGATTTASFHQDISGLNQDDWAALANLYPNSGNDFSMAFTPLPIDNTPTATTTPVIIVPGIIGSQLINSVNSEVWPSGPLLALPFDLHLDQLSLLSDGNPSSDDIHVGDIIDTAGDSDFFSGLLSFLGTQNYQEDTSLFTFPYDWRFDISKTASDTESEAILSLKEKIDEIKAQTGAEKVNLIAHSMGGLLVKKYLKGYGGDSIEKFIDIGTPHAGAPKAFKILNYGDNLDIKFLGVHIVSASKMKDISQNMPAIYQLLPSQNYFSDTEYYVADMTSGTSRLDFSGTKNYLKSQGRNSSLVDRADQFHQEIDGLNPADYEVEAYNFIGCGTPTIGQFYILDNDPDHPIYNVRMINGDGTVPLKSAEALTSTKTYYVRNTKHAVLPSASGVKELILNMLTATSTMDFDISPYSNLSLSSSSCTIPNGRIVSLHSPIELHVYDNFGNHVGPDSNGDIENEIAWVVYEVIDDNKFAFLPDGVSYTVKGSATDSGTFDLRIQEVVNEEVTTTTLWTDVALTSNTQVQLSINSNTPVQIEVDDENDGIYQALNYSTASAGILESTGKVAVVSSAESSRTGSSKAQLNRPVEMLVWEATTTPEITGPDPITKTSTTSAQTPSLKVEPTPSSMEAGEVIKATESANTAIVYKSFTGKLKIVFKGLWVWFKSKL